MIATSNGHNNNLDILSSWKFFYCAPHATARALVKFPFGKIVDILSIRPNDIRYISLKNQFVSAASNAYTQPKAHSMKFTNVAIKKIVLRS